MTKAELIAALADVPDHAEIRVFVDEELYQREHNDQIDIAYVDTHYALRWPPVSPPFVILRLSNEQET